jgi:hypothetical protein
MSTETQVLDPRALDRLAGEVGDRTFVSGFARRYRCLLRGRVRRLAWAVSCRDVESAMDATLSLKVASLTVGATGMAALALEIEQYLRGLDLAAAAVTVDRLPAAAVTADHALDVYLAG